MSTSENKSICDSVKATAENEDEFGGPKFDPPLYKQRYAKVTEILNDHAIASVVDMGCAECKAIRQFRQVKSLTRIVGLDLDQSLLEAHQYQFRPLTCDYIHKRSQPLQIQLFSGDLTQTDERLRGIEAVTLIEVIEHLEPEPLKNVQRSVFRGIRPKLVVMTTPNSEFNVLFPNFSGMRHWDHKFEWNRKDFQTWCSQIAESEGYDVEFGGVGDPPDSESRLGNCSQMAVFIQHTNSSEKASLLLDVASPYVEICTYDYPFEEPKQYCDEDLVLEVSYYLRRLAVDFAREHDLYYYDGSYCDVCECENPCRCVEDNFIFYDGFTREKAKIIAQFRVRLNFVHGCRKIQQLCPDKARFQNIICDHGYKVVEKNNQDHVLFTYEIEEEEEEEESWEQGYDSCKDTTSNQSHTTDGAVSSTEAETWDDDENFVPFMHTLPNIADNQGQFADCEEDGDAVCVTGPLGKFLATNTQNARLDDGENFFLPENCMKEYKPHELKKNVLTGAVVSGQFSDAETSD